MFSSYTALVNGHFLTIDSKDSVAEAVLICGDKILAVGTNDAIKKCLPKNAKIIDLNGRTVIPGITDSHVHLELTVNSTENGINIQTPGSDAIPGCFSLEEMFARIREARDKTPKGEWLIATGSNLFDEKIKDHRFPTKEELDTLCPDHPLIVSREVHISFMNTLAMKTLGWDNEANLPYDVDMGRDSITGKPTGVFHEGWPELPLTPWGYDKLYKALRYGTIKHYTSRGVTSAHELVYSIQGIKAWQQLKDEENLPLRLRLYLTHPYFNYNEFRKTGLRSGFGDEWLSFGGFKLFTQGDACDGNLAPSIDLKYTQEELDQLVYDMHSDGQHIWTHTVTKEGFTQGLLAYEHALDRIPKKDHRLRLEHAAEKSDCSRNDAKGWEAMDRYGIIPICTPQFMHSFEEHITPYKTYLKEGRILPYNSDTTGSQPEATDPWHGIWVCVTRKNHTGRTRHPEECLSPYEAIKMATIMAAWGGFEEKVKGSIEPGKLADMVVLGKNPLECPPDELRTMPVELVMIGGKEKFSSTTFKGALD